MHEEATAGDADGPIDRILPAGGIDVGDADTSRLDRADAAVRGWEAVDADDQHLFEIAAGVLC